MLQRLDDGNQKEPGSFGFLNKNHFVVGGLNCLLDDYGNHLAYNHGDREVQSYTPVARSFCKNFLIDNARGCLACYATHVPPSNTFSPSCSTFNTDFLRIFQ